MTKTERMAFEANRDFELRNDLTCPYDNHYQGDQPRVLFVCTAGLLRSPTAAAVATSMGLNARSCGSSIYLALIPISVNLVAWADHIFFMTEDNAIRAFEVFPDDIGTKNMLVRKSLVLDIEDDYNYMDDALVQRLIPQLEKYCK